MFIPPFCPHTHCRYHTDPPEGERWYYRNGTYATRAFGEVPRFICKGCGTGFSRQTFRLDYYAKITLDYHFIQKSMTSGSGLRSLGRRLGVKYTSVINRLRRLACQALAIMAKLFAASWFRLSEDLCSDGFENFVEDQWQPYNIHILVGQDSQCLYDFDPAHLKRKGQMTDEQKAERDLREQSLVRKRISITESFFRLLASVEELMDTNPARLFIFNTDEKLEYVRAIGNSLYLRWREAVGSFLHRRTSSRKSRTPTNPLFPVNYFDRQIRKDNADQVRETVQFSRSMNTALERLAVYQLEHNFFKPYRVARKGLMGLLHAEVAGVEREEIERELKGIYQWRRFYSHVELSPSQDLVWRRAAGNVYRQDGGYLGGLPKYFMM